MKAAFLGLILCSTAFAGEILIKEFSEVELWGNASVSAKFDINEELGRAWVEYTVSRYEDGPVDGDRIKLPALTYDKSLESVTVEADGQIVECARLKRGRGIFHQKTLKATGACEFGQRWVSRSYDNGFEIVKRSKLQLFINVK